MPYEQRPLDEDLTLTQESRQKIYSKGAIWGFSFAFTTVFGGVLLFQNLRDSGLKREANIVLTFSILFTLLSALIVNIPDKPFTGLSYLLNITGGYILAEHFFKKNFPIPEEYDKKKIWKPLIISILIIIPFVLAIIYTAGEEL